MREDEAMRTSQDQRDNRLHVRTSPASTAVEPRSPDGHSRHRPSWSRFEDLDETVQRFRHDNTVKGISHTTGNSSFLSADPTRNFIAPASSASGIHGSSYLPTERQRVFNGSQESLSAHWKSTPPSGAHGTSRNHAPLPDIATDPADAELGLARSRPLREAIRMTRLGSQSGTEEVADLDVFENLVLDEALNPRNSTPINHQDRSRFSDTPFTDHGRYGGFLRRSATLKSIGNAVRQVGRRVVDVRTVDDDQEESQPLRLPDRMDVDGEVWDSSHDSDDDTSSGPLGHAPWTGAGQADPPARQVGSEGVLQAASIGKEVPIGEADVKLSQTPLRGRSLGVFGPRNKFRLALFHTLKRPYVRSLNVARFGLIPLTIVSSETCSYTESCVLILLIVHVVVLLSQSASTLDAPRIDDGYFDSWEDTALLVIFVLYTIEALARIITTGLIFDPQMTVPVMAGSSGSRKASQLRLYFDRLIWLWRGRAEHKREERFAVAGLQRNPSAVHPSSLIKRHIRSQQAWRADHASQQIHQSIKADTGRAAGRANDTRRRKIVDEVPFEAALRKQIRIVVSGRPYLRHSWQYVLSVFSYLTFFRLPRERSCRHWC